MNPHFLKFFEADGHEFVIDGDWLVSPAKRTPIRNGIPRFSDDTSYSSGNFSILRERHATLQLDSVNGTHDRLDTILSRTRWPRAFFKGKTILECGCGAGPDTEVLMGLGANVVAVDLAGVDSARQNIASASVQFVQADITNLPLKKKSFDIVFCHRVLQHTPNPAKCLDHILQFAKDDGAVFVHSYARSFIQLFRWKYAMRPITKRMKPEILYSIIRAYARPAFECTRVLNRHMLSRYVAWVCIPFLNYRHQAAFKDKSDQFLLEFGIHDTFDALSPKYDNPLSASVMCHIAAKHLVAPFELISEPTITLLRSKVT